MKRKERIKKAIQPYEKYPYYFAVYIREVQERGPEMLAMEVNEQLLGRTPIDQGNFKKSYRFEYHPDRPLRIAEVEVPSVGWVLLEPLAASPDIVQITEKILNNDTFLRKVAEDAYMRALPS